MRIGAVLVTSAALLLLLTGCGQGAAPWSPSSDPGPIGLGSLTRGLGFSPGPSMNVPRVDFASVALADNRLLVTGGFDGTDVLSSCEIYDPVANTWTLTGSMTVPRRLHAAVSLTDGKVLASGGETAPSAVTTLAEEFDPSSGTWSATTAGLSTARRLHQAVTLSNQWVLISGGEDLSGSMDSAELYDPGFKAFRPTGSMSTPRHGHFAMPTMAIGGAVVVGGWNGSTVLSSAEAYVFQAETWQSAGVGLATARGDFAAFKLQRDQIVVSGGTGPSGEILQSNENFNLASGMSTILPPLNVPRRHHGIIGWAAGGMWVAGGENSTGPLSSSEVLTTSDTAWRLCGDMREPRKDFGTRVMDASTFVMVYGGEGEQVNLTSEVFDLRVGVWWVSGQMSEWQAAAAKLLDGRVLSMGGTTGCNAYGGCNYYPSTTAEIYDHSKGTWTSTGSMAVARTNNEAVLLKDGRVLTVGGSGSLTSGEIWDPGTGRWAMTGSSILSCYSNQDMVLLDDGRVLMCCDDPVCQLWNPATGFWSNTAPRHTGYGMAVKLPSGEVLISNEVFSPSTNTWRTTSARTITERGSAAATMLHDGKVLVVGGIDEYVKYTASEIYDPKLDLWSRTANTAYLYRKPRAITMPSGRVLVIDISRKDDFPSQVGEEYDPVGGYWWSAGAVRNLHRNLILLDDGKALALGGNSMVTDSRYSEIFEEGPFPVYDGGVDSGADAGQQGEDSGAADGGSFVCSPGARICWSNRQVAVCRSDGSGFDITACGPGEICVSDVCQGTGIDAGASDSGLPDGAQGDVGAGDAGTDAAIPDSGVADGGVIKVCDAGDQFCLDIDTVAVCKMDGSGYVGVDCAQGQACQSASCADGTTDAGLVDADQPDADSDTGEDTGTDAGSDAGADTGVDAGVVVGEDAAADTGDTGTEADSGVNELETPGCACTTVGI